MKIKKYFGKILYYTVGVRMPVSYSRLGDMGKRVRGFCGKLILEYCGKNVNIEKGARFGTKVRLGDNSGIGIRSEISNYVTIGNNVMMGPECIIYTQNHKFFDLSTPMCMQGFSKPKPVVIEDDVWIGGRVTILPGVRVKKGSIIGAGAVVTKDVEAYTIVGGNPAHFLKKRG